MVQISPRYVKARLCEIITRTLRLFRDITVKELVNTFHADYHDVVIEVLAQMLFDQWITILISGHIRYGCPGSGYATLKDCRKAIMDYLY